MFWNLRNKLLIPILGMVLLGSSAISLFSYLASRETIKNVQTNDALNSAQALGNTIELILNAANMDVRTMSSRFAAHTLLLEGKPEARRLLESQMGEALSIQPFYSSMTLLDRNGVIIASTSGTVGGDRSDRDYFQEAMKGDFSISAPSFSKSTGASIIVFAAPSRDEKGKVLGVAAAVMNLSQFSARYVAPVKLGNKGFAMVVDRYGTIVAHKDPQRISQPAPYALREKLSAVSDSGGFFSVTLDGKLTHCYMQREERSGWTGLILVTDADFYQGVRFIALVNALLALASILLTAFVIYLVVRSVTNALNRGVAFASAVAEGDLDQQLLIIRNDEIGVLGGALTTMVEKLKEMITMAKAATQAKSDFLARMSHEIRTPMNAILGMAYLALQAAPEPRQKDYLTKIQTAAQSLLGIINDILDFSKIEAGKMSLEAAQFSLSGMLQSVYDLFEQQIEKEKKIRFTVQLAPDTHDRVIGDSLRLAQVCINLCTNAIKFTKAGEVTLRVREQEDRGENILLHFSVSDTGIGIAEEQQQVIFNAFAQADGSMTRRFGGTGLGLAICKMLVKLMRGDIWVESAPGVGSTFHFTVLLEKGVPEQLQEHPSEILPLEADDLANARVLLVEDNELNQEIAVALLEELGIIPALANNGAEALEICKEREFDLVLMDIQMPVMDGLEATRQIRRSNAPGAATVPIIAMTANAMQGDKEKSLLAGMNDHLTKPIDHAELKRILSEWLRFVRSGRML